MCKRNLSETPLPPRPSHNFLFFRKERINLGIYTHFAYLCVRTVLLWWFTIQSTSFGVTFVAPHFAYQKGKKRHGFFHWARSIRSKSTIFKCQITPLLLHSFSAISIADAQLELWNNRDYRYFLYQNYRLDDTRGASTALLSPPNWLYRRLGCWLFVNEDERRRPILIESLDNQVKRDYTVSFFAEFFRLFLSSFPICALVSLQANCSRLRRNIVSKRMHKKVMKYRQKSKMVFVRFVLKIGNRHLY